ncbi:alanine racemase [Lachnospiraceae bacterium NE2001]|nr:alanine racemase [Lachnospiraceae bacterium NE2001]
MIFRRVEADIDLDAIRYNIETVKALNPTDRKVCLVIKADAYGHGSVQLAKEFSDIADYYAVACIDEAVELRNAGIETPILILGYTDESDFVIAINHDITLAIYDVQEADTLSRFATKDGKKAKVHIKVDSGMSRIGFQCDDEGVAAAMKIYQMEGLDVEGIFTHYAKADYIDKNDAKTQYDRFSWFVSEMEKRGAAFKIRHIDNSAGAMEIHSEGFDMVRLGIVIYGLYPSEEIDKSVVLKPAMSLKSKVIHVKTLPAGRGVGYGWSYVTEKDTRVATVSVGYADGYPRALSNLGRVLIHGEYAPIIGRVCMDQIMVDVTGIDEGKFEFEKVKVGDEVVLFGTQGENSISVEEIAEPANSFNYEAVCNISRRVERIYFKDGKEVFAKNYLVD